MKKILSLILCALLLCLSAGCNNSDTPTGYAVLLGEGPDHLRQFPTADTLVIDGAYFSTEDVKSIKDAGVKTLYSYLNIGSLENFRDRYDEFLQYTLGLYPDWPEERWMDVSNARWQDFILAAAGALAEKGFDGFFIDNTDVYYNYPTEEIYQGIVSILSSLTNFGKDIVINGGDVFVRRYIEDGMPEIFSGVNQENVFTAYDFGAQKASLSTEADRDYYTEYLNFVEAKGYDVFILEYAKSQSVAEEAQRLAEASGWTYYISDNIDLRLNK